MLSTILKCNQTFMFGINEGIQNNPPPSPATNQKKPYISIFNILKNCDIIKTNGGYETFLWKTPLVMLEGNLLHS